MKAVLYARVSTTDQSCEMQLLELREYASRRGWQIVDEFVDTGWSGATASRPELDRLMRDARLRRFDAVLVWKLDRWGRSVADCIRSIQELASHGIRFVAATQNIDTDESNPASRLLLHLFAAFGDPNGIVVSSDLALFKLTLRRRPVSCPQVEILIF
jgi:putative DNA-invertase from lambdoid prophage Rac